ncbi:MAG: S4 domain-containing protein, partial [Alphaproteobacteria bacterium]
MSVAQRQRVDLWLHRARLAKTRAAAARLISEGGV